MATNRLPIAGQDRNNWGNILNSYLRTSLNDKGGLQSWVNAANRPATPDDNQTGVNLQTGLIEQWNASTNQWVEISKNNTTPTNVTGGNALTSTSVAALKAIDTTNLTDGTILNLLGYYSKNDGAEGVFYFDKNSTTTANNGTVIAPTTGSGRWFRQAQNFGVVNVKWFGAKGDGTTNDTVNIQAAVKFALSDSSYDDSSTILFPKGTFVMQGDGALLSPGMTNSPKRHVTFLGLGGGTTKIKFLSTGSSITYLYNTVYQRDLFKVNIRGIAFTNNFTTSSSVVNSNCGVFRINPTPVGAAPFNIIENGFVFQECQFDSFKEVMRNDGGVLGDSSGFVKCEFGNNRSVLILNNQQCLGLDFIDCDGILQGPLVKIEGKSGGAGGNVNVWGGNLSVTVGSLLEIDTIGTGPLSMPINFYGIRVELYNSTKLFTVTGTTGQTNINFNDILVFTSTGGAKSRVVGNLAVNTAVNFNHSNIDYGCQFQFDATNSNLNVHNLGILTFNQSTFYAEFVNNNLFFPNGVGRARATGCYASQGNPGATPNQNFAMDFDLNCFKDGGLQSTNIRTKEAILFNTSTSNWPTATNNPEKTLSLPKNCIIKSIKVFKPAAGSDSSNYQIFVGNNSKSVTYGQSTLAAANQKHSINLQFAPDQMIDTLAGDRIVRIWATGGGSTVMKGGFAIVEYY